MLLLHRLPSTSSSSLTYLPCKMSNSYSINYYLISLLPSALTLSLVSDFILLLFVVFSISIKKSISIPQIAFLSHFFSPTSRTTFAFTTTITSTIIATTAASWLSCSYSYYRICEADLLILFFWCRVAPFILDTF